MRRQEGGGVLREGGDLPETGEGADMVARRQGHIALGGRNGPDMDMMIVKQDGRAMRGPLRVRRLELVVPICTTENETVIGSAMMIETGRGTLAGTEATLIEIVTV
jgi:hypothetical protein